MGYICISNQSPLLQLKKMFLNVWFWAALPLHRGRQVAMGTGPPAHRIPACLPVPLH